QEEAKEGRWCGRPRRCCHCRQVSSYHLFGRWWVLLLFEVLPRRPWEPGGYHYLQDHHVIHSGWAAEDWQYSHPPYSGLHHRYLWSLMMLLFPPDWWQVHSPSNSLWLWLDLVALPQYPLRDLPVVRPSFLFVTMSFHAFDVSKSVHRLILFGLRLLLELRGVFFFQAVLLPVFVLLPMLLVVLLILVVAVLPLFFLFACLGFRVIFFFQSFLYLR
ncbi:hypothetical protein TcCL_NonESM12819, partial [Trypanosoma cruzi]